MKNHEMKIRLHDLAPEFFLCWMRIAKNPEDCKESVKRSREIADDIVKLPKEDVVTWIGYLGWNFFLMYDMIREYDPELAKMIKEKCQSWKDGFQNE